jgi:hypothetical protein
MQAQPSKDITHAMPLSYPSLTEPMSGPSWYKPMPDSSSHMLKSLAQQDKRRSVFLLFFRPNDEAVVLIIWSHEYKGTYINIKDCVLPRHCPRLLLSRIRLLTLPLISVLHRVFTSLIVCLPLAGLRSVPSGPACHMRPWRCLASHHQTNRRSRSFYRWRSHRSPSSVPPPKNLNPNLDHAAPPAVNHQPMRRRPSLPHTARTAPTLRHQPPLPPPAASSLRLHLNPSHPAGIQVSDMEILDRNRSCGAPPAHLVTLYTFR